jgi:uncharacterized protein
VLEPMKYVYETYCKPINRKCFSVGVSMGANIMTNLLGETGENCFLTASFIIQNPMQIWETDIPMRDSLWGIYDTGMGTNMFNVYYKHNYILKNHFKKQYDLDLEEFKKTFNKPSLLRFDHEISSKLYGYKDKEDYYY